MSVILSRNNKKPYEIIDDIKFPVSDIIITGTDTHNFDDYLEKQDYFYLVVEKGSSYNNLTIEVSLSYELGVSFEISETDAIGKPIKWTTHINLGNIDATDEDKIFLLAYRWRIINNIYIVHPGEKAAIITISADA